MADEQQPERRVSGGAMYDAARDSWEDHHFQQQHADEPGPPPLSHPNELLASAQHEDISPSVRSLSCLSPTIPT
ncbi:hypothetical protein BJX65DRAFT_184736 [Aspergillus insuetus]